MILSNPDRVEIPLSKVKIAVIMFGGILFVAAGLITWESIKQIEEKYIKGQRFIAIKVENPKRYIERQSGLKRVLMNMNYKMYETPIYISPNSLKIEYDELWSLLKVKMEEYTRG